MKQVFKKEWFKASDYPADFVPKGAEVFIAVDPAYPDGDCTVKGFYDQKTGEFHIQEVVHNARHNRPSEAKVRVDGVVGPLEGDSK